MGNIMLCGSLCDSCEVEGTNNNATDKNTDFDTKKIFDIDQILIKEISERENMERNMTRELELIREDINKNIGTIKEYCKSVKKLLDININNIENNTNKSISDIKINLDKIKENNLYHAERDINIVKTKMQDVKQDIIEMRKQILDINEQTIKNTTKLEFITK